MSHFWKNFKLPKHSTANQFFFRFLSSFKFTFKNKKILEIGFLNGDDLLELKKRGSKIYGLEINRSATKKMQNISKKNFQNFDACNDKIPFKNSFDLIYHNDLLYYLNDNQINNHIKDVYKSLKFNGLFLFSFIEDEIVCRKTPRDFSELTKLFKKKRVTENINPMRILNRKKLIKLCNKIKFKYIGEKIIIESFDTFSKKYKIHRYIALKKC